MARSAADFGLHPRNAIDISTSLAYARFVLRARRTRMPGNDMRVRPFSSNTVTVEKYRARQPARTDLLGATRPSYLERARSFAARVRRASYNGQLRVAGRPAIERMVAGPRVAVVAGLAPVLSPQAAINAPYPASPLSAATSKQESLAALGCTRNATVNSTLDAPHAGFLLPPICATHPLADRSGYRPPSKSHMEKNT